MERIKALGYDYASQPKETISNCNLCGENYFVQITHQDRYGYEAPAFACGGCGLVFLNPRMNAQAYAEFYGRVYRPLVSAYHGRIIDAKSIQDEQKAYAEERAGFLAPYIQSKESIVLLDIGGSTGVIAKHFVDRFGYRGVVLDPSAEELAVAARLGLQVKQGFIEQSDFGSQKFDLILLCQTIDHLLDIATTLEKVRGWLADDGIFFVDIVDFRAGYLRKWQVSEAIKVDHPYYLTEASVETYLRRKGFEVLRKGYAADRLHVNYICRSVRPDEKFLPSASSVEELLREIRTVQNAPHNTEVLQ